MSEKNERQVIYVERAPKKTGCCAGSALVLLLLCLIPAVISSFRSGHENTEAETRQAIESAKNPEPIPESKRPSDGVTIVKANWKKGGFGSVLLADITLKNSNSTPVHDVRFAVDVSGESGTRLDTLRYTATITLLPGEQRTLKGLNFGRIPQQAAQTSFRVTQVKEDFDGMGL